MKKDKNLPNKNIHSNKSSGKSLPNNSNYSRHQSPNNPNYQRQSTDIVDQTVEIINIEITIQDQIETDLNLRLIPVPIQILEIDITQMTDLETLHIKEKEIIPTI